MNPAAIPSLSARGLQKDFIQPNGERLTVLKSVDFDIYPGEMVAIMGPSGSGKSTLLQILGLMMRPDKGELSILGGDAAVMTESARDHLRRGKIGFLFQMDSLMEELTLEENLRLIQRIKGIGFAGEPVSSLGQVAGRLNLERRLPSFPRELSVGECCRANLLRALMGSPSLVFADEPTGNLDAKNAKHLMDEFLGLLSRQTDGQNPALVLATHNIEVARLADKMMILEDGFLQSTAPSDGRRSS